MEHNSSHFMTYCGVHFKTCPIEFREAWNLISNAEIVRDYIYKVTNQNLEFVNIGTCNRFDLCIFGKLTKKQVFEIFYDLAIDYFKSHNLTQFINQPKNILTYLYIYQDSDALKHLFKVTASLDSLIVGEQQILGQVKSAFKHCSELGFAKKNAHKIFSLNFRIAKRIRMGTDIGLNSVSIGHAAIEMIHQVFESFEDKKILLIGAGDMAKIIAKNVAAQGVKSLYVANRTFEKVKKLSFEFDFIIPLNLSHALEQIHEYDICIVAASGNNFIITNDTLKNFRKKRKGNLSVFIDVSVPRKITPEAHEIDDLFLFYVDDLDRLMEKNRNIRKKSAKEAEHIIELEVQSYEAFNKQKENLSHVAKMHRWMKKTIDYEVNRYLYNLSLGKNIDPSVIANAVTKRIISHAALMSRTNKKLEYPAASVGDMLEFLFNLSSQNELEFKKKSHANNIVKIASKQKKSCY